MNYDHLHEVEVVEFHATEPRPLSELLPLFKSLGFTLHDDVLSLDRSGKIPPWQHASTVEVEVLCNGVEVFGFESGKWDTLQLQYLFASLPTGEADKFLAIIDSLTTALGITPHYQGLETNTAALKVEFERILTVLHDETGYSPGSEGLAILIQATYPRERH